MLSSVAGMSEPQAVHTGHDADESRIATRERRATTASRMTEGQDPFQPDSIYTNLLLTEHALRSQFAELQRSRRRGLLFFWAIVSGAALLTYRVRSQTSSTHKIVALLEQLLMVAMYIAIGLFFLTGMYTKVFVIAPQFLADTNKGLKSLNVRLVRTKSSFKEKILRLVMNPIYSDRPGGLVKLVPMPRAFSYHFIEDWEVFREEYWEKQHRNRRRARKARKPEKKKP